MDIVRKIFIVLTAFGLFSVPQAQILGVSFVSSVSQATYTDITLKLTYNQSIISDFWLDISFPANVQSASVLESSAWTNAQVYLPGQPLNTIFGTQVPAKYILISAYASSYDGYDKTLKFRIYPNISGNLTFVFRGTRVTLGTKYVVPTSGGVDQQGYFCYSKTITVGTTPPPSAPTMTLDYFTASSGLISSSSTLNLTVQQGQSASVTFDWAYTDCAPSSVKLYNGSTVIHSSLTGSHTENLAAGSYSIQLKGTPGSSCSSTSTMTKTITVNVTEETPPPPPPAPTINLQSSLPNPIYTDESPIITWSTTNGTSATMNGASVALSGSMTVSPQVNTTYTLVATGNGGTTTSSLTVTVAQSSDMAGVIPTTVDMLSATSSVFFLADRLSTELGAETELFLQGLDVTKMALSSKPYNAYYYLNKYGSGKSSVLGSPETIEMTNRQLAEWMTSKGITGAFSSEARGAYIIYNKNGVLATFRIIKSLLSDGKTFTYEPEYKVYQKVGTYRMHVANWNDLHIETLDAHIKVLGVKIRDLWSGASSKLTGYLNPQTEGSEYVYADKNGAVTKSGEVVVVADIPKDNPSITSSELSGSVGDGAISKKVSSTNFNIKGLEAPAGDIPTGGFSSAERAVSKGIPFVKPMTVSSVAGLSEGISLLSFLRYGRYALKYGVPGVALLMSAVEVYVYASTGQYEKAACTAVSTATSWGAAIYTAEAATPYCASLAFVPTGSILLTGGCIFVAGAAGGLAVYWATDKACMYIVITIEGVSYKFSKVLMDQIDAAGTDFGYNITTNVVIDRPSSGLSKTGALGKTAATNFSYSVDSSLQTIYKADSTGICHEVMILNTPVSGYSITINNSVPYDFYILKKADIAHIAQNVPIPVQRYVIDFSKPTPSVTMSSGLDKPVISMNTLNPSCIMIPNPSDVRIMDIKGRTYWAAKGVFGSVMIPRLASGLYLIRVKGEENILKKFAFGQ